MRDVRVAVVVDDACEHSLALGFGQVGERVACLAAPQQVRVCVAVGLGDQLCPRAVRAVRLALLTPSRFRKTPHRDADKPEPRRVMLVPVAPPLGKRDEEMSQTRRRPQSRHPRRVR